MRKAGDYTTRPYIIGIQNNYPANDKARLEDLRALVDLLTSITFFRLKVQEQTNPPRAATIVLECIRACMNSTYRFLFDSCIELCNPNDEECEAEKGSEHLLEKETTNGPLVLIKNLEFWDNLVKLMIAIIEEDKTTYAHVLNQYAIFLVIHFEIFLMVGPEWQHVAKSHNLEIFVKSQKIEI